MTTTINTEPTIEPIEVDELKSMVQIEHADDDLLIAKLITAARVDFEQATGLKLMTQALTILLDADETDEIEIVVPYAPVISLTSLKYYTQANTQTEITAGSDFYVVGSNPMRLVADAASFTSERARGAWEIKISAGFGATRSSVPRDIRRCIGAIAKLYYEIDESANWTDDIWRVVQARTHYHLA